MFPSTIGLRDVYCQLNVRKLKSNVSRKSNTKLMTTNYFGFITNSRRLFVFDSLTKLQLLIYSGAEVSILPK